MALQPKISCSLKPTNLTTQILLHKPLTSANVFTFRPTTATTLKTVKNISKFSLLASSADPIVSQEVSPTRKMKLGVVVKPMEKPRIVLKLIWLQKTIGVGLDQVIPGLGTIPLSPYYFWPKEDAWEQLKMLLERKPWIPRKQMHLLLNQATDIINLWQETGCNSL